MVDTRRTVSFLLNNEFQDGQPDGSISPQDMRDMIKTFESRSFYSVQQYGALGDDNTNDSPAIQAAINDAAANGGGIVYLPPTGHAYKLSTGLTVPAGVTLLGSGAKNNMRGSPGQGPVGADGFFPRTVASRGTWIRSTDTANPAVELTGTSRVIAGGTGEGAGASVRGINFVYDQAVDNVSWSPIAYPFTIHVTDHFQVVDDILICGATQGIHVDGSNMLANGGDSFSDHGLGGTGVVISNIFLNVFNKGVRFEGIVDTVRVFNVNIQNIFYGANQTLYTLNNLTGFDFIRCDNPWLTNVQVFEAHFALRFTNCPAGSGGGGARSMTNAMLNNVQINLCREALTVNESTTMVTANICSSLFQNFPLSFLGVGAQSSGWLLNLGSDNVQLTFSSCTFLAGNNLLTLGAGGAGFAGNVPAVLFAACQFIYNADGSTGAGFVVNANANVKTSACMMTGGATTILSGAGTMTIGSEAGASGVA